MGRVGRAKPHQLRVKLQLKLQQTDEGRNQKKLLASNSDVTTGGNRGKGEQQGENRGTARKRFRRRVYIYKGPWRVSRMIFYIIYIYMCVCVCVYRCVCACA